MEAKVVLVIIDSGERRNSVFRESHFEAVFIFNNGTI